MEIRKYIDNNNQNKIQNINNFLENRSIREDNYENYTYDFDGIYQKLISQKNNGKNKENEYYCNLLLNFSQVSPLIKIELIKLLYSFNSNSKDKKYKYYIFNELSHSIKDLNQNESIGINFNNLIGILLEEGKFYMDEENYFYSYKCLYNSLYRSIINIKNLRGKVKEKMFSLNDANKEKFREIINKNYKEIYIKLKDIKNNNINPNADEYIYAINYLWLKKALKFLKNIYSFEINEREKKFNKSFDLSEIYNYYFEYNDIKGNFYPYPWKINNYAISDFKDIWEDPLKEDENYLIKDNMSLGKEYCLVLEKDWYFLKDYFGATNEIKRKISNLELIKIKLIILDKKIVKSKNLNLLKPKYIQTNKNLNIKEFKEKIIRCVNYTIKNNENEYSNMDEENFENIDEKNTCDEDINMLDMRTGRNINDNNTEDYNNNINIYQNIDINNINKKENIHFYKLKEENKEILIEIFTAFINEIPKYETLYINKIPLKYEDLLESLFKYYNEEQEILIIEITYNNSLPFLSQLDFNQNGLYECSICKKIREFQNRYNCQECHMSFFCSKKCYESPLNGHHTKLHEYLKELKRKNINNINNKKSLIKYNANNLVGLMNLGNTCFINSTLQCLFNTYDLSKYFLQNIYKKEINKQNKQGYNGKIAEAFANLLYEMQMTNLPKLNPINFLRIFFTNNKSLNLRHQQDAQEFLSILLDCLHEDLNRITNKPYILLEEQKDNENDSEASQRFWNLYKKRENSIIVDLFHGQFKSKIICSGCGKSSITYEPFIFLGLPIPSYHQQIFVKFFFANKWEYFGFNIKKNSTILSLIKKAIEFMKIYDYKSNEPDNLLYNIIEVVILDENKIIKNIYDNNKKNDKDLLINILEEDNSLEIVLYEKANDKDNFNIYAYPIKGDDYDNSTYPLSFSVNKNMTLKQIIESNRQNILNMYINSETRSDIQMGLLHKKNNGWIYFFSNNFKSREFCPFCNNEEENFCFFNNYNKTIGSILQELKNYTPVLFVIGNNKKKLYNRIPNIPNNINNGLYLLNDCLKLFCEEELLNKDNMWYCNKCKKHNEAKKQIRLFRLPNYLIIQLKKFKNSSGIFYSSNEKKDTFIKYPINNLDLSNFVEDNNINKQKYDLYAVIQHHGDISEGHYTAICKINDNWIFFNDSILSKVYSPLTKDAYLLFYRKNEEL